MRRLLTDRDVARCDFLKSLLESQGIECLIKNEAGAHGMGGGIIGPLAFSQPELWVVDDARFEEALAILRNEEAIGQSDPVLVEANAEVAVIEQTNPLLKKILIVAGVLMAVAGLFAIFSKSDSLRACCDRADGYYRKGDYDRSIEEYTKALRLRPDIKEIYLNRGLAYCGKGDFDHGIQDYSEAIRQAKYFAKAYRVRGNAYIQKGDLEAAAEDYSKHIAYGSPTGEDFFQRGYVYHLKRAWGRALNDYNRAIELEPGNAGICLYRGILQYNLQSWKEALGDFRKACESHGDAEGHLHLWIWSVRSRLGEREEATRELKQFQSENKQARTNVCISKSIQLFLGEITEEEYLRITPTAAQKGPDSKDMQAGVYFSVGTKRLIDGDKAGARMYFKRCLETGSNVNLEQVSAAVELEALGESK